MKVYGTNDIFKDEVPSDHEGDELADTDIAVDVG
jgi:hypothetical protein